MADVAHDEEPQAFLNGRLLPASQAHLTVYDAGVVLGATVTELVRNGNPVGKRVELARYRIPAGERVLYGQRINGVVRITDVPVARGGRAYLVERELEQDGNAALHALIDDYVEQSQRHGEIPMHVPLSRYLEHIEE